MKKKVFLASLVMTIWAGGFYTLGRHHGVTKGKLEIPSVQVKWPGSDEPAKEEATSAEVVDYVAISDSVCDGSYDEKFGQDEIQAKAKVEAKDASAK